MTYNSRDKVFFFFLAFIISKLIVHQKKKKSVKRIGFINQALDRGDSYLYLIVNTPLTIYLFIFKM